jgi:hypothetical protein
MVLARQHSASGRDLFRLFQKSARGRAAGVMGTRPGPFTGGENLNLPLQRSRGRRSPCRFCPRVDPDLTREPQRS